MKVVLVNGSPNKEGCTYTALREVEKTLKEEGIDTEIFWIGNKPIEGCIACKKCKELKDPLIFALQHEEYVTSLIHAIYDAAFTIKDYRSMQFLDWFIKEQCEEETNAHDMINKYDLFGNDSKGLYMLDNELKQRVYSAPSLTL